MAKKASSAAGKSKGSKKAGKSKVPAVSGPRARRRGDSSSASDAIKKLLESPLVAELLAVGATAALAALAEHRFGKSGEGSKSRTSKAVKQAGKAAAAAIGRRIATEFDEIRKASAKSKDGAAA